MEKRIVIAVNQPLELHQVIGGNGRRLEVVQKLSKREFETLRRENAKDRAAQGIGTEGTLQYWEGEDRMRFCMIPAAPPAPPRDCKYFYLVRDI